MLYPIELRVLEAALTLAQFHPRASALRGCPLPLNVRTHRLFNRLSDHAKPAAHDLSVALVGARSFAAIAV